MSAHHAATLLVKACQDEENLKHRLLNNFVPRDLTSLKSEKISVWNVKDWRMKTILPSKFTSACLLYYRGRGGSQSQYAL